MRLGNKCFFFIISIIFFRIITSASYLDEIKNKFIISSWSYENGFPANNAIDILQGSEEYIWIATYDGLVRFDGKEFKLFNKYLDNGFDSASATVLFKDSKDRLWIGSNENGVIIYKNQKFELLADDDNFRISTVTCIQEDNSGNIWVAGASGLAKLTEDLNTKKWKMQHLILDTHFKNINFLKNGELLLITNTGELLSYQNGEFLNYKKTYSFLKNYQFQTSIQDDLGNIWLGTISGDVIKLFPNSDFKIYKNPNVFSINKILQIENMKNENMILFCSDKGIGVLESGDDQFRIFSEKDGLINNSVENLFVDKEFNIWIASKRMGLQKLTVGKFTNYTLTSGLPYSIVNSVEEDYKGNFWIGTDSGLAFLENGNFSTNKYTDYFKNMRIRQIYEDSHKNIWISSYTDKALIKIKDDKFTSLNTSSGLSSNSVRLVYEDSRGYLWVGTSGGLNLIKNPESNSLNNSNDLKELSSEYIMCIEEDDSGNMIIGSNGRGIFFIDSKFNIRNLQKKDGLAGNVIFKIYNDKQKNIWIATNEGVSLLKDDSLYNFTLKDGFLFNSIYQIIEDDHKTLWFTTSKGVFSIEIKDLLKQASKTKRELPVKTYNTSDGFLGSSTPTSWGINDTHGKLWFPTLEGLSVLDTKNLRLNYKEPKVIIEEIEVDNETFDPSVIKTILPDVKRIKIKYAALSFKNPKKIKFKYYLKGFDQQWSKEITDREVVYTNLPYGEYVFYIKASNDDGVWNATPYSFSFYRKPSFYELKIFHFFLICLAVILTAFIFNIRLKRIDKKKKLISKMLEDTILALTGAIDAKDSYTNGHSKRVADLSEKLGAVMGITGEQLIGLKYTALLHDIGKIGIDDTILKKQSRLTPDEFDKIKAHPVIGGEILNTGSLRHFSKGAKYHHEKYDGSGYCCSLEGDEIPLEARIIAVADAYDAMVSNRPYKVLDKKSAIEEINKSSGKHFDPKVVAAFNKIINE